ncbi:aminophospholipid translocase [Mucor velutinosus]|uniref:Aminophospholipid translocase n=1 Tax=Mucor velutinosus TaxID=708070 RepID=A0AAN7I1Q6_9FUNG|nr:aminophospholipid translocase [Mucor velutinosus]
MNTVHDTKEWQIAMPNQQAPLQTPPIATAVDTSPKLAQASTGAFPSNDYAHNNVYHQHPQHHQQHQPMHNYPSSSPGAATPEADGNVNGLPGMIAHSQPSTPRPENTEAPLYRQPIPFAARNVVRGRANLFANETGPYFSSTKPFDNLYSSDKSTLLSVRVQSKMDRGFFLADNDWTCYRRNYFQVSSVFSVHGFNHYYSVNEPHVLVKDDDGALYNVQRFLLGVSARVANSEKEIELIQHTPKRDKGPQYRPKPKPITPGGNLSMSSVANNQNIVTFERVQFKTATANNGKRRAAQQYYICIIELFAETDRGQLIKIGSCQSAPLVVRGRSPGHYADNNQERHHPYPVNGTSTSSSSGPVGTDAPSDSATPSSTLSAKTEPMTPPGRQPIQQQPQPVYYSKPQDLPQPMMHHGYDQHHQAPQQPQNYTYYSSYPHYANAVQQPPSNVSSPMSHPPLPSPYTHHAQVPNYAVHDAGHSDPYSNEAYHNNAQPTEEVKMHHHHQQFQMQQTGPIESPHSGYDWQRARYNSSSSGSSSVPSPGAHQGSEPQQTYFSHHQQQHHPEGRSYSPTTPTYSPSVIQQQHVRKYNHGANPPTNMMNNA